MGIKGIVASTAALSVLLQEGIGDTIRISLTPEPGGSRTQEVIVAQEILQTMGLRAFTPMVAACPGCGRTTSTFFQELAGEVQDFVRARMPEWKLQYDGVENMTLAVMGCIVNGPGESKHANIGISLPGTGEAPSAPVYEDGEKTVTLRGDNIADEFKQIIERYVAAHLQEETASHESNLASRARDERHPARRGRILGTVRGHRALLAEAPTATGRSACRIVEPTPLFKRAIGEVTDIVEKEMYSFIDSLNGEPLTLRPEGTAGCVRAVIQHNLLARQPQRLYYIGPMFRHERPQKGRYRQFHQVGVEALGFAGPDIDAELILMCARLWDDLGLDGIELQLNSLGQPDERAQHRAALIAYFEEHAELLDEDAQAPPAHQSAAHPRYQESGDAGAVSRLRRS